MHLLLLRPALPPVCPGLGSGWRQGFEFLSWRGAARRSPCPSSCKGGMAWHGMAEENVVFEPLFMSQCFCVIIVPLLFEYAGRVRESTGGGGWDGPGVS